jgi:hypothetical protein
VLPVVEVPFSVAFFMLFIGRRALPSDSKSLNSLHESGMEHARHVLCGETCGPQNAAR